ncbi:carboxypeptidase-like regulatory domain-containing protein [Candidatus Eisenbacteria bacterium]|uniref:Carboxypeptidase-like regulatory domain-containing protein n=1 Tax=Eiseniibacteriota bacterium TaxID=2212470 RepID=A0ABV6YK11_UNCEI
MCVSRATGLGFAIFCFLSAMMLPTFSILLQGCNDDDPGCPVSCLDDKKIQGSVIGGSGPLERVQLRADLVRGDGEYSADLTCWTSADGTYELPVVSGEYTLTMRSPTRRSICYSALGLTCDRRQADTLALGNDQCTFSADFHLGAFHLILTLPSVLSSEPMFLRAERLTELGEQSYVASYPGDSTRQIIMEGLIPGSYLVYLDFNRISEMPDVVDYRVVICSELDPAVIVPHETFTKTVELAAPESISGSVAGDWALFDLGLPRVDFHVSNELELATVEVDPTGSFSIPIFAATEVRINVSLNNVGRWIGGDDFESATIFTLDAGQSVTLDPFPLGGLICRYSGDPDWSYRSRLSLFNESGLYVREPVDTQAQTIAFPNLPSGRYTALAVWDGPTVWRPQWFDRAVSPAAADSIPVAEDGSVTEVVFTLESGGQIVGNLRNHDGTPARGMRLLVEWVAADLGWGSVFRTDDNGDYDITGLPDGDIKLGASVRGEDGHYRTIWYPGVESKELAHPIPIEDAGTVPGVDWSLLP